MLHYRRTNKISGAKAWLAIILVGAGGSGHTHCCYTHSVEMGGNVSKIHQWWDKNSSPAQGFRIMFFKDPTPLLEMHWWSLWPAIRLKEKHTVEFPF